MAQKHRLPQKTSRHPKVQVKGKPLKNVSKAAIISEPRGFTVTNPGQTTDACRAFALAVGFELLKLPKLQGVARWREKTDENRKLFSFCLQERFFLLKTKKQLFSVFL